MLRELHTRYGRYNIGYFWLFMDPAILGIAIAVIHLMSGGHVVNGVHPAAFTMVGYIVFVMFRSVFTRANGAIESNAPLLHHRDVTLQDILFARSLLDAIGTVVAYLVLVGIAIALGWTTLPPRPIYIVAAMVSIFAISYGMAGAIVAAAYERPMVERFVHPGTYLFMPLSGCFFAMSWFPESARDWLILNPFVQIFEMLRYGQFESSPDTYFHPTYIFFCTIIMDIIGVISIRRVSHHVHLA